jgi:hypothetical protein
MNNITNNNFLLQVNMDSQECPICIEKYTSQLRKKLTCMRCQYSACIGCYKKIICDSIDDPHCMNCKQIWNSDFLNQTFTKTFMATEYKVSRSNVLFSREQSYFSETLIEIEKDVKIEKINDKIDEITKMINDLQSQKLDLENDIKHIKNIKIDVQTNHFSVRKCMTDECKGMIEKRTGHCIICDKTTCLNCNVLKTNDEHECNQDDINTWKMIIRGSKPCPRCATMLNKNGGCSQMWCPNCHVAFDWNTGSIENRRIHNPHYFEYLRRNQLPNVNPEVEHDECENIWNIWRYKSLYKDSKFSHKFRDLSHIVNDTLVRYRNKLNQTNIDIRKQFIRNVISEETFKKILVRREFNSLKNRRIVDVLETFEIVCRNILNDIKQNKIDLNTFYIEVDKLYKFCDDSFQEFNQIHKTNLVFNQLIS